MVWIPCESSKFCRIDIKNIWPHWKWNLSASDTEKSEFITGWAELQLPIITVFTMCHNFVTTLSLTADKILYIWSLVWFFLIERTIGGKETLEYTKKHLSPWSGTDTEKGAHEPQQESTCKRVQWSTAPVPVIKCLWGLCGLLTTEMWTF